MLRAKEQTFVPIDGSISHLRMPTSGGITWQDRWRELALLPNDVEFRQHGRFLMFSFRHGFTVLQPALAEQFAQNSQLEADSTAKSRIPVSSGQVVQTCSHVANETADTEEGPPVRDIKFAQR